MIGCQAFSPNFEKQQLNPHVYFNIVCTVYLMVISL